MVYVGLLISSRLFFTQIFVCLFISSTKTLATVEKRKETSDWSKKNLENKLG